MLIMLTGPSAVGKSTIEKRLVEHGFTALKSHTTRAVRDGVETGNEYHFVSVEEFDQTPMVESVIYAGNKYGLSEAEVRQTDDDSKLFVVVVEMHGVIQLLKKTICNTVIIFVDAPNEQIRARLESRCGNALERLRTVEEERKLQRLCDCSVFNADGRLDLVTEAIIRIAAPQQTTPAEGPLLN